MTERGYKIPISICAKCGVEYWQIADHVCHAAGPLTEFDAALKDITQRRGETYGHPGDDFALAATLKRALPFWEDRRFHHIAEMICVKLARLATTPTHVDSLVDIAGYARTWVMILERDYAIGTKDQANTSDRAEWDRGVSRSVQPPSGGAQGPQTGSGGGPEAPGPFIPCPRPFTPGGY